MIDVRDIHKTYGRFEALRGVSFQAESGQILGLLGPNGAGKTTTIRIITGYLPPSSGFVEVDGLDSIDDSIAVRSRIGYMPESTPLYPEMRVEDYLHHRGRLFRMTRRDIRQATGRVIERCRLQEARRRRLGQLSKGYRQRVGLAAALLHDPPVLILDEPTSGLDPAQIVETRSLIRELAAEKTMLISSHILPEVELTCDRIIIIARGQVRAMGDIPTLLAASREASAYLVEARLRDPGGDAGEALRKTLSAVKGVGSVRIEAADTAGALWSRGVITPEPGASDLREAIAQALTGAGLLARELRRDAPTLESLFIRLTQAIPAGEAAA